MTQEGLVEEEEEAGGRVQRNEEDSESAGRVSGRRATRTQAERRIHEHVGLERGERKYQRGKAETGGGGSIKK